MGGAADKCTPQAATSSVDGWVRVLGRGCRGLAEWQLCAGGREALLGAPSKDGSRLWCLNTRRITPPRAARWAPGASPVTSPESAGGPHTAVIRLRGCFSPPATRLSTSAHAALPGFCFILTYSQFFISRQEVGLFCPGKNTFFFYNKIFVPGYGMGTCG